MLMIFAWIFLGLAVAGIMIQIHDMKKEQEMLQEDERADHEIIYSISA